MNQFYSLEAIKKILPQRFPVLMLDRAEDLGDGNFAAVKNVTMNEPQFVGHFPEHPILPGVLQLEAMKQLGELAVRSKLDPENKMDVYMRLAEKVKFRRPITPGDRMRVEVHAEMLENNEALIKGKTMSKSGVSCEAAITLAVRPRIPAPAMDVPYDDLDKCDATPLDISKIASIVPHRYPFLLIDYVAKCDEGESLAVKNVSGNEMFFANAADDYAVMPESILCEIAAQSGCAAVLSNPANQGKLALFMSIDRAESFGPIFPGDRIVSHINLPPTKSRFGKGFGKLTVNGETRLEISLMFAVVDR